MSCAAALTPAVQKAPGHRQLSPVDRFLTCASAANGAPITVDPAVWRALALSPPPCPASAKDVDAAFAKAGALVLDSDDVSFAALESHFSPSPFSPPRFGWDEIAISVTWKDLSTAQSSPLSERERQKVTARILAETRPVPLTPPARATQGTRVEVPYLIRADVRELRKTGAASLVSIVGQNNDIGRLVFGRVDKGTVELLWDSPLFGSWMLMIGYSDLDGDGRDEILLSSAAGMNGDFTLFSAFDAEGRELTRQPECGPNFALGLITDGITCPISCTRMEIVPGKRAGKELLVWQQGSASPSRYALRNGVFLRE